MIFLLPKCNLYGEEFDPVAVEKMLNLTFKEKNCPGDLGLSGRYKGLPIPYGSATLEPSEEIINSSDEGAIRWLLEKVAQSLIVFRTNGATDITLDFVVFHDGQCNLEFSTDLLKLIASVEIPLTLSTYHCPELVEQTIARREQFIKCCFSN